MKGNNVKLSIAIPTYNRSEYLDECLNSIYDQKNIDFNNIEILISDNDSSDKTKSIVEKWKKKFPIFTYTKNTTNIGPTLNIRKVLDMSRGDYVWLFSDDDILINSQIIDKIIPFITKMEYAFIWVGAETIGKSIKKRKYKNIEVDHEQLLLNLDSGLISRCIFKKESYSLCKKSFLDTRWDHFGLILETALKNKSLIITEPFVGYRPGTAFPISRPDFIDFFKVIDDFAKYYPDYAIKKIKKRMFFKSLVYITAGAKIRRETEYGKRFVKYYKDIPLVMVIFSLIWYLPNRLLLIFFRKLYKFVETVRNPYLKFKNSKKL